MNTLHLTHIIPFRNSTMAGEKKKVPRDIVTTYDQQQKQAHNLSVIAKYLGVHFKHVRVCQAISTPDPETCLTCRLILVSMNGEMIQ